MSNKYRTLKIALFLPLTLFVQGCLESDDEQFVSRCEKVMLTRLKSPSSYKRVGFVINRETLSRENFRKQLASDRKTDVEITYNLNRFDEGSITPTFFTALVSYDAANTFNAQIRAAFECKSLSNNIKEAAKDDVAVDGFTETGWVLEQVRRSVR